jgi:hypothetical protein
MMNESVKIGMKIGSVFGVILFLVFGVMGGFYFGSYGTLILLQKLMGGTVEPTLFVRAAVVVGIGVGIAATATVSIVTGGVIGTALGYLVSLPKALAAKKAEVKVEA